MRLALPLALSFVALAPAVASARPFSTQPDDRPWGRGTLMPSFGLGGSFSSRGGGTLLVGAGLTYFAVNNLGVGLHLRNFTTFLPNDIKSEFPGVEKRIPTNEFSLTPSLMFVLYRSYRFSPYIHAGVGPVFLNHGHGVVGEWVAGPGVLIGLGRRLAINVSVSFSSRFPGDKCNAAYNYDGVSVYSSCGFRWGIQFGLVFGFGVGRQRRDPDDAPYQAPPPPSSPPPPQTTYPPPAPPPAYTPAEPPSEAPPGEQPPPDPPAYAPPDAAPPAAPPATTPPPGESMPVTPPPG